MQLYGVSTGRGLSALQKRAYFVCWGTCRWPLRVGCHSRTSTSPYVGSSAHATLLQSGHGCVLLLRAGAEDTGYVKSKLGENGRVGFKRVWIYFNL